MYFAAPAGEGGSFAPLLLIVLLFGVMYFMMIRPQQKRRREAQAMQSALGPGDEIVTIGGLHATVVEVTDDVVTVEIAPGVNARYARPAIARVVKQDAAAATAAEPLAEEPVVAEPVADDPIPNPVVETRKSKD
ncbi:preprotein translocase subunit YajC [Actinoplanes sp. TFC3]|uniref:preprotein translocase subunit YajC n=1 Tax=Actinoplanes sp. TFC3 TaxID=1710355 RepID=UPI000A48469F|nr:preprotein translocase subunit YajC [Actinoplanes sp. TFC3]